MNDFFLPPVAVPATRPDPVGHAAPAGRWRPALAAVLTAALLLLGLDVYARQQIRLHALALAALNLPENTRGVALQRQLFALPGCLPVYGSSELAIVQPTRADLFFHGHQQGFRAVAIGQPGDRCLVMLQELAALGDAVRGKKVAVFLSPVWFLAPPAETGLHAEHRQMAATFSPLQAGRTLLDSPLKPLTKRAVATRLLDYDNVLQARAPLLRQSLWLLHTNSWLACRESFAVRPLLDLQTRLLGWQDRFHQLELLHTHPKLQPAGHFYESRHKHLVWTQVLAEVTHAEAGEWPLASGDQSTSAWDSADGPRSRASLETRAGDEEFLRRLAASPEWSDLDLLLRTLHELGAYPLFINQPINGAMSDREGVTPQARQQYYARISQVAARHRVRLCDFSAEEEDPAFFTDKVHPSAKAWVLYDQALAEFYAGKTGEARLTSWTSCQS